MIGCLLFPSLGSNIFGFEHYTLHSSCISNPNAPKVQNLMQQMIHTFNILLTSSTFSNSSRQHMQCHKQYNAKKNMKNSNLQNTIKGSNLQNSGFTKNSGLKFLPIASWSPYYSPRFFILHHPNILNSRYSNFL